MREDVKESKPLRVLIGRSVGEGDVGNLRIRERLVEGRRSRTESSEKWRSGMSLGPGGDSYREEDVGREVYLSLSLRGRVRVEVCPYKGDEDTPKTGH